ncbi:hypothetical protein SZN_33466 [Streptomyces zinciresistens K42]|uniref:Uncharacterized protein n=2 Tax=Streptomyces TaxID=1883 RepID=G2GME1_9ACTN|nr:hypothetical protein SZN_33466 [Streptomyces zinciresistens K42]
MTIRVYTVTRDGRITADSGTRRVKPPSELPDNRGGYPPCRCPRHRAERAAAVR